MHSNETLQAWLDLWILYETISYLVAMDTEYGRNFFTACPMSYAAARVFLLFYTWTPVFDTYHGSSMYNYAVSTHESYVPLLTRAVCDIRLAYTTGLTQP